MPIPNLFPVTLFLFALAAAIPAPAAPKHLFILSGQSNMRKPLPESFRDCVSRVFGDDNVIVVTVAHPSQPIKRWYKAWSPPAGMTDDKPEDNGALYDRLLGSVQRATKNHELASVTFVWMQGEADAGKGWGSVYQDSFFGILEQFKTDLKLDNINFVIGRINDFWLTENGFKDGDLIRSLQQQIGEEHPNGNWINTDDLNKGVNPWGGYSFADGHFPPQGYRVMGQRFARKACQLIEPNRQLDKSVFAETFFDDAGDVTTHAAVGKAIDVGGGLDALKLLDDKFAPVGTIGPGWVGFSPEGNESIELVVDLGESRTIDAVGVNLRISSADNARFPKKITYSFSPDGESYTTPNSRHNNVTFNSRELRAMNNGEISPQTILALSSQRGLTARYLKVVIDHGDQWLFLDELIVNPR